MKIMCRISLPRFALNIAKWKWQQIQILDMTVQDWHVNLYIEKINQFYFHMDAVDL